MVPPGDNLEFHESRQFQKSTTPASKLRDQILAQLKSHPHDGVEFARGVRKMTVTFEGMIYVVLFKRIENRVGLMHIHAEQAGAASLDRVRADIIKLFGPKERGA